MKTDQQRQQDVITELAWEPSLTSTKIGIEVKDGVVTLAGRVDSYIEKWEAQRAAQRVSGVTALAVEMDVALPGSGARNDVDIARAASNVLRWSTYWPEDQIKVLVESGWITLSGELDWEYQREAAERSVRGLMGVIGISNQIVLKSSQASKRRIQSACTQRINTYSCRGISCRHSIKGSRFSIPKSRPKLPFVPWASLVSTSRNSR